MNDLSWHQRAAIRRAWRLRKHKAHIWAADYLTSGRALCGARGFEVYVDPEHADNPRNSTCKQCLRALHKTG